MGSTANVLVGVASVTLNTGSSAILLGYTTDGVNLTIRDETADIKVEESEGAIIRKLIDQEVEVTMNLAEGTLANFAQLIPGSVLVGSTLTIGGSALQSYRVTIVGIAPGGYDRVIVLTSVNPAGEIGIPFKKGSISIVPVTLKALVADTGVFGEVIDGQAAAPTLSVGANTKSNDAGTIIEAKFSDSMADPTGKHGEFYFTEEDFGSTRQFSAVALKGGDDTTFELTVSGAAITAGKALALYYVQGSVYSAAIGILESFSAQAVVARP